MTVVNVDTCFGHKLKVFEGDVIGDQVINKGCYDKRTLDAIYWLLPRIKPGISLDVGANIGNHAVVIASLSKKLFAFEPNPVVFSLLRDNLLENDFDNAVAINAGLSTFNGNLQLFVNKTGNLGASSLSKQETGETNSDDKISTAVLNGDSFIANNEIEQVDFIKIDVEGHEVEVIEGLAETIKRDCPLIMIEWTFDRVRDYFFEHDLFNTLFSEYVFFGLSHKLDRFFSKQSFFGQVKRVFRKTFVGKKWCLVEFDPDRRYSNILLVPQRFSAQLDKAPML